MESVCSHLVFACVCSAFASCRTSGEGAPLPALVAPVEADVASGSGPGTLPTPDILRNTSCKY